MRLYHIPSGIEIKCQRSRLQASNRYFARRDLCDKLEEQILGIKNLKKQEQEKFAGRSAAARAAPNRECSKPNISSPTKRRCAAQ